jgi:hypothetical protein
VQSEIGERPESCGKPPVPTVVWSVESLNQLPAWR